MRPKSLRLSPVFIAWIPLFSIACCHHRRLCSDCQRAKLSGPLGDLESSSIAGLAIEDAEHLSKATDGDEDAGAFLAECTRLAR